VPWLDLGLFLKWRAIIAHHGKEHKYYISLTRLSDMKEQYCPFYKQFKITKKYIENLNIS